MIAGPLAGRTLAELGAEVLHVENPRLHAAWVQPFHVAFGAGKRSVTLDLQREADRTVFWDLVERFAPDVVLHSFRPGAAARLGLDEASFRAQVPGVVYVRVSAWGERGPWAERPGWEQTVQAATGVQAERGGDGPPDLLPIPFHDLGTGLLAAFGTGLALLHRRRTGTPQRVGASLAATSGLAQSSWLFDPGAPPPPGRDALGWGPLHRFYEARDGWLFLAAPRDTLPELARVPGLEGVERAFDRGAVLERAFATAAVSVWQARIAAAGLDRRVAVVPRTRPATAMDDPQALARDLVRRRFQAEVGRVTETGPPLRLSGTPCEHLGPAPPRGADTRPELERLGVGVPRDAPPPEAEHPEPPAWSPTRELAWAWNQARWGVALVAARLPQQSLTGLHLRERLLRSLS